MSMGVYIKGMEMPVFEHQSWDIRRGADGKWYMVDTNAETSDGAWHEIVPVPPHGRLGDLDAAVEKLKKLREYHLDDSQSGVFIAAGISQCIEVLTGKDAPTIIPAEEGK